MKTKHSKYELAYENAKQWAEVEMSITRLKALAYQQSDKQAIKDELEILNALVETL